jgi:hypothetical protein
VECFYESVPIGAPVNIRYQVIKGTAPTTVFTALSFSFFPPPQDGCRFSFFRSCAACHKAFFLFLCVVSCGVPCGLEKREECDLNKSSSSSWTRRCRWFPGRGREHVRPEP